MSFIQIAYCTTVPFLLLFTLYNRYRWFFMNVLAVSNVLLVGYSILLIRQLTGLYLLGKQLGFDKANMGGSVNVIEIIRLVLVIILPFFSLIRWFQRSLVFSILLLLLLYSMNPLHTWNTFDLFNKIPAYFCLLCSGYALLWLLKKLPYQSPFI